MINLPLVSAGIISFILSMMFIPILISLSNKFHWFDEIDERKIHTGNISRLAGIAIFYSMLIGFMISMIILKKLSLINSDIPLYRYIIFISSFFLIHLIGVIDDFKTIRPRYKFIIQIIAALVIVISGGSFSILHIPFINITVNIGFFGYVLSLFWIIGACNAVNLIDGMDGLSGGLSAIASLCLAITAIALGHTATAVFSFAIFGAVIGFLVFNFPPAKIFMGDSGSLFLGFALATLPLFEINYHSDMSLIISISILFIPVMDTLTSMLRRILRKQSPFHPDREHIHHKLLDKGFSIRQILYTLYTVSVLLCTFIVIWSFTGCFAAISGIIILWIVLIIISLVIEKLNAKNK